MEKKVKGSWLIHHTNKLQVVTNQRGYENTFMAGKAGILLSAISSNNQITISNERLRALSQAASINLPFELPKLIEVLKYRNLIETVGDEIAVLGVTTTSALQHTVEIFEDLSPLSIENAAIELAEKTSEKPLNDKEACEEIGDLYCLSGKEVTQLMYDVEEIGFVDVEKIGKDEKLYFNGNLFRRDAAKKIKKVLDSLSPSDQCCLIEVNGLLKQKACIPVDEAIKIFGEKLFQRVAAIGLFDVNIVSNSTEEIGFLTLPSAFSKFSSSMIEDAFDLAKAFVSSITYGMTKSRYERGQIQMVDALLAALIRGESVGPVPAIAEDYKILEFKGVVQVYHGSKKGRVGPMLRLLKKEVVNLRSKQYAKVTSVNTPWIICPQDLPQSLVVQNIIENELGKNRYK
jgi:hypothetical protein